MQPSMAIRLKTFDNQNIVIADSLANLSEFIKGIAEGNVNKKRICIKLNHPCCTFSVIQKIAQLSQQLTPACEFVTRTNILDKKYFDNWDRRELLKTVLAVDFLDIYAIRKLIAERVGVIHLLLENATAVSTLIDCNASIEDRDDNCQTPLHCAAARRNLEVLSILLEANASVNVHDRFRNSPLHFAAQTGIDRAVELLLNAAACPGARDWCKQTPLHQAAAAGHESVVRNLIQRGACIDAEDSLGRTPLHLCAISNMSSTARALVTLGVSRLQIVSLTKDDFIACRPM